jgi:hypothetical protein
VARLVVGGALANKPGNGGEAWVRLSWVLGLRRLGHDVHFVEELAPSANRAKGAQFFMTVVERFGLAGTSTLIGPAGERLVGLPLEELEGVAERSDLLVNISGNVRYEQLRRRFAHAVYVDLDPGFTQFWHAAGQIDGLKGHDAYFTVAESIGTSTCTIPVAGIEWGVARQPVVLAEWPVVETDDEVRFTSVATWRGPYGPIEVAGRRYGLKLHEFRKFAALPRRVAGSFELALDIAPADEEDLRLLRVNGWRLADPQAVAGNPDAFRHYVQGSGAEFSVAQEIYVETGSGWFSDRSARYLASGKPVLVQDTGFSRHLPVGEGLLAFRSMEEAVEGVDAILADYAGHSRAARRVAEEHFDSDVVLRRFLHAAGVAA